LILAAAAGQALDLINIMAYDAGTLATTGFNYKQSHKAHRCNMCYNVHCPDKEPAALLPVQAMLGANPGSLLSASSICPHFAAA
jgi:hypothetical protein